MNVAMSRQFWRDWGWIYGCPLQWYDSRRINSILHQHYSLASIHYARWISIDSLDMWVRRLHSVWSIWISYKLMIFMWLVIYQGIPSTSRLAESGLMDGLYLVCQHYEI
jgi:hypothetical protein